MIGLTLPVFILGSLTLALVDYLWRLIKPPVPNTTPLSQPYTPPFTGGQCVGATYQVNVTAYKNGSIQATHTLQYVTAPIKGISTRPINDGSGNIYWGVDHGSNRFTYYTGRSPSESAQHADVISSVSRDDGGGADNCGDVPNPSPPLPIGGGGLAQSPPPVLYPPSGNPNGNLFTLIAGIAAIAATAATAATAAAAAAAAAAQAAAAAAVAAAQAAQAAAAAGSSAASSASAQASTASAIGEIAKAIAEIIKLITGLEKEIRKLKTKEADKDKEKAESVVRYDFGSANRDGFIKLYPVDNPDTFKATFVDVQVFNIPSGSGKYFGQSSPHHYKYKSLGQIHFVSSSFGILESREIDFARTSENVPDNAFGFFYHFGLDGVLSANISAFYIKTEKQEA